MIIDTPQNSFTENIPAFLLKTYDIIENPKYNQIISWTKNGQGFIVKKVKQFSENILPVHFRHSNYASFVRQLNMYDFHKTRQQNQQNAFKNAMFKKGYRYLLQKIQRKDYKKNKQNNKQSFNQGQKNQQIKICDIINPIIDGNGQIVINSISTQKTIEISNISSKLENKSLQIVQIVQNDLYNQDKLLKVLNLLYEIYKINKNAQVNMQEFWQQSKMLELNKDLEIQGKKKRKNNCKISNNNNNILQMKQELKYYSDTTIICSNTKIE